MASKAKSKKSDKSSKNWTQEQFMARAEEVQASDVWQEPQAWSYALMHSFYDDPSSDDFVQLVARFKPEAINYGEHLNPRSLAHIVDVVGPEVYNQGVLLTQKQLKELQRRVAWVNRDGTHVNVDTIDQLVYADGTAGLFGAATKPFVIAITDLTAPLASIGDTYLRDYLFSMGMVDKEVIDTGWTSRFPLRPTFVETSEGTMTPEGAQKAMWMAALWGMPFAVFSADKVPFLLNHLVPEGVRVPSADTVRLGAFLDTGTTIMQGAGFVNIEAVVRGLTEGRMSGRVRQLGELNEIGGGASTHGTMAGGNKEVITLGSCNLLESNCSLGISFGDRCKLDANHAVKGTSLVRISGGARAWRDNEVVLKALKEHGVKKRNGIFVKAKHLSGISDAIFRRNDVTGVNEVIPRGDRVWWDENALLLKHN